MDRLGIFPASVRSPKKAKAKAKDSKESVMCVESSGIRPGGVPRSRARAKESTKERAKVGKEDTKEKAKVRWQVDGEDQ